MSPYRLALKMVSLLRAAAFARVRLVWYGDSGAMLSVKTKGADYDVRITKRVGEC